MLLDVGFRAEVVGSTRKRLGLVMTVRRSWPVLRMAMFSTQVGFGNWWIK